ncbi:MAG: hypothetical protein CMH48_09950 [Muricauda sp.]|nr:hypothetical protein [Allomuricauda sp.]MAU27268.1 hypothetical protein [Allomuricauda sp.]MBC31157.1 hypothetical protein [Allomuricauda sp.]|tara:strand:+ start:1076 stop:1534 length:459 start_codon:yes stop_codon:yes gene_type:complete
MNRKIDFKSFAVLLILLLTISCKTDEDRFVEKLDGGYTLNQMKYKGEDIMPNVLAAMLSFDNKEELLFKPPIVKDEIGKFEKYKWSFSKKADNKYVINFETGHPYFRGDFEPQFEVDYENRQLHLILKSENTYINCTRLYVFENFGELKNEW